MPSNFSSDNRHSSSLYLKVRMMVESLSFRAFRNLVWLWLAAVGYSRIEPLARSGVRGRRTFGGADFVTRLGDHGQVQVAVQIRFWKSPLSRQAIDEFRGFLLHAGIPAGVIICRSSVSPAARRRAEEYSGRPVRLIPASRLAESMIALGLGVGDDRLLDFGFFRTLGALDSASSGPNKPRTGSPSKRSRVILFAFIGLTLLWLYLGLVR